MQDDQQKELDKLRRENAALKAGAMPTDPPLTFKHKPIAFGGQGCLGVYGLWKPTPKDARTLQLYPNQYRRLRRDIDVGMQYIMDNIEDMGWNKNRPEQHRQFIDFYNYLKDEKLFRIH